MRTPSRLLLSFLTGSALLLGVLHCPDSLAYYVRYDHYAHASHGPGPFMDEGIVHGQPQLYEEIAAPGHPDAGNHATLKYYADLPAGTLGSHTYATGDVTDFWPYGFTATAKVAQIYFTIRLDFTVAAGEYPAGVDVGLSGRADGGLWSEIDSGAMLQYGVEFGHASIRPPLMQIGIDESRSMEFHEPFDLLTRIVNPGTVLSQPQVFPVVLSAWISDNWTWAVLSGAPPGYNTGAAESDLYSGIRFTRVTVPPGVTWDSEDGVFLRDVTDVNDRVTTPRAPRLEQNFPNPFNPRTTIRFELPQGGRTRLEVYDIAGRLIRKLLDADLPAGSHEAVWDGKDSVGRGMPSGSYFARLSAGGRGETVRMGLVR